MLFGGIQEEVVYFREDGPSAPRNTNPLQQISDLSFGIGKDVSTTADEVGFSKNLNYSLPKASQILSEEIGRNIGIEPTVEFTGTRADTNGSFSPNSGILTFSFKYSNQNPVSLKFSIDNHWVKINYSKLEEIKIIEDLLSAEKSLSENSNPTLNNTLENTGLFTLFLKIIMENVQKTFPDSPLCDGNNKHFAVLPLTK